MIIRLSISSTRLNAVAFNHRGDITSVPIRNEILDDHLQFFTAPNYIRGS
jgi:hypothetical protein